MRRRVVLLTLCTALFGGCSHTLPLTMPVGEPVKVVVRDGPQYSLDPTTQDFQRLSQWIARNRSGWHRYIVDDPLIGVELKTEAWALNFSGHSVLATTPQGRFTKGVDPYDYVYLRERHGGH